MSLTYPIPRGTRDVTLTTAAGQTVFGPIDFRIYDGGDLEVWSTPPGATRAALLTNWTATPAAPALTWPATFNLTLAAALPAGTVLSIEGAMIAERSTDVTRAGVLRSQLLEGELDKLVVVQQELRRGLARTWRSVDPATSQVMPLPQPNQVLGWSSLGLLENIPLTQPAGFIKATLADMETGTDDTRYATPAGVAHAIESFDDPRISVMRFGADKTGVLNSSAAFSAAMAAAGYGWNEIVVPDGVYKLNTALTGQVTWLVGSHVTFTGSHPKLPGRAIKLGAGTALNTGGSIFGAEVDWYEPQFFALASGRTSTAGAEVAALSHWGAIGLAGVSRTSDSIAGPGGMSSIGAYAGVINDNVAAVQTGYALYADALRVSGAGITQVFEGDIINLGTVEPVAPNAMFGAGATIGHWIASGGGVTGAHTASAAIGIINNGAAFQRGIVFHDLALEGTAAGYGEAISFSKNHWMAWYNGVGQQVAAIGANTGSAGNKMALLFSDLGIEILNGANQTALRVLRNNGSNAAIDINADSTACEIKTNGPGDVHLLMRPINNGSFGFFSPNLTAATAGGATALPANPVGYMKVLLNGQFRAIPYYSPP